MSVSVSEDLVIDAAINRFARDGFGASLRAIASDAEISAALIIKRFGSKDALRTKCDEVVLRTIRTVKEASIREAASGDLLSAMAQNEKYAPILAYTLRSVLNGDEVGRSFINHMIDDAVDYMDQAVQLGLVNPSHDEPARIRYMVLSSVGALLLSMLMRPSRQDTDLPNMLLNAQRDIAQPMFEIYTNAVFTQPDMFEDYVRYLVDDKEPESEASKAAVSSES